MISAKIFPVTDDQGLGSEGQPQPQPVRRSMTELIAMMVVALVFIVPTAWGIVVWFDHQGTAPSTDSQVKLSSVKLPHRQQYLAQAHLAVPTASDTDLLTVGVRLCTDYAVRDTNDAVKALATLGLTDLVGKDGHAGKDGVAVVRLISAATHWICPLPAPSSTP